MDDMQRKAPAWQGTGTIIFADDEPIIRKVTVRMLETLGFRVLAAQDGLEAVELFRQAETERNERIAAIFLDLNMPKLGGQEAMKRIRGLRPDVPIILTSGEDESETFRDLLREAHTFAVPKPYQFQDLIDRLKLALES